MRYILLCFILVGCSTSFFGGRVIGQYYYHYDNQIRCAYVAGWGKNKCMCEITDPNFSPDKSFISAEEWMCGSLINKE